MSLLYSLTYTYSPADIETEEIEQLDSASFYEFAPIHSKYLLDFGQKTSTKQFVLVILNPE